MQAIQIGLTISVVTNALVMPKLRRYVPTDMTASLDGTLWALVSFANADGKSKPAVSGAQAWIEFKDGNVGGRAGCNTFSSSYMQRGTSLTFGAGRATLMACQADVMTQERSFLDALQNTRSFTLTDSVLTLQDVQGKAVLVFNRQQPMSLTGHTWRMLFVNNGKGGAVSAVESIAVTLRFEDSGKVEGNGGCNGFGTTYTVDGDAIAFAPFVTTLRACADDKATEQEGWFFRALPKVSRYSIRENRLELRDADGALQASFVAE
jgi:heat shock protein HslJ